MKCPYCGDEMIRGYLMSSRDITFAVDNPTKVFFVLKNRTIWNWVKVQEESLIVKLIVVVVVRRFWLIMQIDKSIYAQGGGLHEKNYTLDVSGSSNYVGVSMACGYIHKRWWRHGSLLHSVFCSESYLCNLFRSIRWQGHKNILATTNYYSTILFAWDMAVL